MANPAPQTAQAGVTSSAAMPMMDGVRAKMLNALDQYESYFELTLTLPDVVKDLKNHMDRGSAGKINLNQTIQDFVGDEYIQMGRLTHHVSPRLLRSIIQGTVAYDFIQQTLRDKDWYPLDGRGTYVVSVAIKGRNGAFLNVNELRALADQLEQYADGGEAWLTSQKWDSRNARHMILRSLVRVVERSLCVVLNDDMAPKFASSAAEVANVRVLAKSLRERADKGNFLDAPNGGRTYQVQAPLMVGCTTKTFDERFRAHTPPAIPHASALNSTTHTWALLLCTLKQAGLDPEIVKLPVMMYYIADELPLTEKLISVYGQSYIFQCGLNVIQAGARREPGQISQNLLYQLQKAIFYHYPWLTSNLKKTLDRVESLSNRARIEYNLTRVYDPSKVPALMGKLEAGSLRLKFVTAEYLKAQKELEDMIQAQKDENEKMKQRIQEEEDLKLLMPELKRLVEELESSQGPSEPDA